MSIVQSPTRFGRIDLRLEPLDRQRRLALQVPARYGAGARKRSRTRTLGQRMAIRQDYGRGSPPER